MQITFLGTGSAMPTGHRFQTGILLQTDATSLLIDCGSGVLHRLAQTSVGYEGIDAVLLTHHHLDHVSDLMPLLKARWLAGATESFEIVGPTGTQDLLSGLFDVHDYMQNRLDLTVRDVTPGSFSLGSLAIQAMETRHSLLCHAYRFNDLFVFSGDSEAFTDLIEFADGTSVLAHDCSFPNDIDVSNHPTPTELGTVLANANIGRVYLTHLYPHTQGKHESMLDSIAEHYDGDVRFASDGLTIEP